jgi:alkylation response protein AidB-like acyl-CoA dehydrogenase
MTDSGHALGEECLDRARNLLPMLRESAPRIEADRQLPADVLDAMHGAELFRMTLPRELGGAEIHPQRLAQVTETIAMADASAAWCLGQGSGCAMASAYLSAPAARRVFGPPDSVLAWGAGPAGKAQVCDGGFRISGRWGFASGGKHATWLGAHCQVVEEDGTPRLDADGKPVNRTGLIPRDQIETEDDWYVMGLRGTRSEGYVLEDVFVEEELTLDRGNPSERRLEAPLYKFSTTMVYASCFSGVAMGIARAMLDDLLALAMHKTPRGANPMRESPVVQTRLAELEAQLSSARAFQQQSIAEAYDSVIRNGRLELDPRVRLRLATSYAINQATDVSEQVYRLAGATSVFESRPFERRFRDAHAVSQQVQGRFTNFETVGRHMLGHEVGTLFL